MGRLHDKDVEPREPREAEPSTAEPPGRVEVDSRGHNVWRWTRDANDSTSVVLKRLDNDELSLEPTQKVPAVPAVDAASKGTSPKGAVAKATSSKSAVASPSSKSASPKAASPKSTSPKGASPKGASAKGAPVKGKQAPAGAEATKKNVFHPALQPEHGHDSGGGFDPYNSR